MANQNPNPNQNQNQQGGKRSDDPQQRDAHKKGIESPADDTFSRESTQKESNPDRSFSQKDQPNKDKTQPDKHP